MIHTPNRFSYYTSFVLLVLFCLLSSAAAAQGFKLSPNDTLQSITILPDNIVSFKVYAPDAKDVKIGGSDIPDKLRNTPMVRQENGVWEAKIGPLEPGAYRYEFILDNIHVLDPKNPITSESNMNSWSLMYVPGAAFMDTKDIPHGAIAETPYYSQVLKNFRRMHVYTPPGYQAGTKKYPVLYLLHGAFDSDDSWGTVGRVGYILDNLIAEKKIVPMIVVMPAGHTGPFTFASMSKRTQFGNDEFVQEFSTDIKPNIESNYRVIADRAHRAIAGLSMGGAHTLNIAIPHLAEFSYIGVFSSGIFGIVGPGAPAQPVWESQNLQFLKDDANRKTVKVVWFATGKEDFLLETTRATVALLKKHQFNVVYKETDGGHTWKNWREYINEFSQLLFK